MMVEVFEVVVGVLLSTEGMKSLRVAAQGRGNCWEWWDCKPHACSSLATQAHFQLLPVPCRRHRTALLDVAAELLGAEPRTQQLCNAPTLSLDPVLQSQSALHKACTLTCGLVGPDQQAAAQGVGGGGDCREAADRAGGKGRIGRAGTN